MSHSKIRGEYWVSEEGDVDYADGSIGDLNHEGWVRLSLMNMVCDHFGTQFEEMDSWKSLLSHRSRESVYEDGLIMKILGAQYDGGHLSQEQIYVLDRSPAGPLRGAEVMEEILQSDPLLLEVFQTLNNEDGATDFAINRLDWIKVNGNHFSVKVLDRDTAIRLADAVMGILYEEWDGEAEQDESKIHVYVCDEAGNGRQLSVKELREFEIPSVLGKGDIAPEGVPRDQVIKMDKALMAEPYKKKPFGD